MNKNQASLVGTGLNVAGQALAGPTGGLSLVASNLIGGFMQEVVKPEIEEYVKTDVNQVSSYAGRNTGLYGGKAQKTQKLQREVGGENAALGVLNQISGVPGLASGLSGLIGETGNKAGNYEFGERANSQNNGLPVSSSTNETKSNPHGKSDIGKLANKIPTKEEVGEMLFNQMLYTQPLNRNRNGGY
ncbi:MAG: hypothetical protein ACOCQ4_02045 [bacterium]